MKNLFLVGLLSFCVNLNGQTFDFKNDFIDVKVILSGDSDKVDLVLKITNIDDEPILIYDGNPNSNWYSDDSIVGIDISTIFISHPYENYKMKLVKLDSRESTHFIKMTKSDIKLVKELIVAFEVIVPKKIKNKRLQKSVRKVFKKRMKFLYLKEYFKIKEKMNLEFYERIKV